MSEAEILRARVKKMRASAARGRQLAMMASREWDRALLLQYAEEVDEMADELECEIVGKNSRVDQVWQALKQLSSRWLLWRRPY